MEKCKFSLNQSQNVFHDASLIKALHWFKETLLCIYARHISLHIYSYPICFLSKFQVANLIGNDTAPISESYRQS